MKLYTWNVLNPAFAAMTWSGFVDAAAAKRLGQLDQERNEYRLKAVMAVVASWLAKPAVVCLQEVWPALRAALDAAYGERCASSGEAATLVSGHRIESSRVLPLPGPPPKTALVCEVDGVQIVNVHFHWKWADLANAAKALKPSGPQVVAGDFNKEWAALGDMLEGRAGTRTAVTAINPTTNKMGGIDHVLATPHFERPRPNLILKAAGYTLRYDFKEILKKGFRPYMDVSDHSPLQVIVRIKKPSRALRTRARRNANGFRGKTV
jgi:hypothetical protein